MFNGHLGKKRPFEKDKIKKILILRYRFIGDTILSIPFIRNVRENFSGAQIDVLVSPNSGELIERNVDIDEVIYYDNTSFHKYEKQGAENGKHQTETYYSFLGCARALRAKNYDLCFVLKRSFSSAILAFLTGSRYRIGFNTELRSFLLTHPVSYDKKIHELDNFLSCIRSIGIEPKKYSPVIYPTQAEATKASGFVVRLDRFKPKILIHATSAHPYKQWPKRYFAKLMDDLHEEFEAQFVFTGAKVDKVVYDEILKWTRNKKKIRSLDLCGLTTLRECFPLYKELDAAICVDSGNAHIAAASGIPTYILYGPTTPERWLPIGKNVYPLRLNQLLACQPCDLKVSCDHLSCMKLLTPEFIFSNLISKLEKRKVSA